MSYEAAKEKIDLFNEAAGNYVNVGNEKLKAQLNVVVEEVNELINAENNLDKIDGICDAIVTMRGLQYMLMIYANDMKFQGYNVAEALDTIADNNLTKFIVKEDNVDPKTKFGEEVVDVLEYTMPNDQVVWIGKDKNGKVRKPLSYQAVDIVKYLPKK